MVIPEFNSNRPIKLYTIMAWDCAKQEWKSVSAEGFPFKMVVFSRTMNAYDLA
jgi:hypothetical protein